MMLRYKLSYLIRVKQSQNTKDFDLDRIKWEINT
jgi:hypothetical protein